MNSLGHRLVGLSLVGVLVLSACSSEGEADPADSSSSATGSASASASVSPSAAEPYLPVPDGIELTAQGTELSVGDDAVVAYEPRQRQVAVLDITVTSLEKTTFARSFKGWRLDATKKKATPYFVRATIKNVGESSLAGREVPLYIVDGSNTLIEASTFASTFKPCPSQTFPKKFGAGAKAKVCLVFLAPDKGELTAVSFRPIEEFNPITWIGEVTQPGEKKKDSGKKSGNKKSKGKKKQG